MFTRDQLLKIEDWIAPKLSLTVLILFVAFCLFPMVWITLTSFKSHSEIISFPPSFIFFDFSVENYINLFLSRNFIAFIYNSTIIGGISTFFVILLATPAAYAIARYTLGGKFLSGWILSMRMFPPIALVLPLFVTFRYLNLLHSYTALIIIYTIMNLPLAIWLMIGFIKDIPREIDEAALVDGCNLWQTFFKIILPICAPGIISTAILSMIFAWNEFLFSLIIGGGDVKTVPVAMGEFITDRGIYWGPMAAASTLAIIPMIIFARFVQQYIIRGLTMGAVK